MNKQTIEIPLFEGFIINPKPNHGPETLKDEYPNFIFTSQQ